MTYSRQFLLLLVVLVAGCGPQRGAITGQVKLNGQPLDKGIIYFNSLDPAIKENVDAPIVNGQYSANVIVGKKQVQITAPIVTGTRPETPLPGAPMVEITAERLPAKYNSASELTLEITPGKNSKDWELQADALK